MRPGSGQGAQGPSLVFTLLDGIRVRACKGDASLFCSIYRDSNKPFIWTPDRMVSWFHDQQIICKIIAIETCWLESFLLILPIQVDTPAEAQPRILTPKAVPALKPKAVSSRSTPPQASAPAGADQPSKTAASANGTATIQPTGGGGALRAAFGGASTRGIVGMVAKKPSSAFAAMAKPVPAATEVRPSTCS